MAKQQRRNATKAPNITEALPELSEEELAKVTGGKVSVHDFTFTKPVDVSSVKLP